jgi:hypothetical protein
MITQTNAFVVVLDTCVLAPMPLCDTLLRLAEDPAFYMPRWSAGILDELRRVLLPDAVQRRPGGAADHRHAVRV